MSYSDYSNNDNDPHSNDDDSIDSLVPSLNQRRSNNKATRSRNLRYRTCFGIIIFIVLWITTETYFGSELPFTLFFSLFQKDDENNGHNHLPMIPLDLHIVCTPINIQKSDIGYQNCHTLCQPALECCQITGEDTATISMNGDDENKIPSSSCRDKYRYKCKLYQSACKHLFLGHHNNNESKLESNNGGFYDVSKKKRDEGNNDDDSSPKTNILMDVLLDEADSVFFGSRVDDITEEAASTFFGQQHDVREEDPNNKNRETSVSKTLHIGAFFLFPTISLVAIYTAIALGEVENKSFSIYGNIFSVGILLSGGIVHNLAEATKILQEFRADSQIDSDFPLTYTIFGATIIFLLCIDNSAECAMGQMLHLSSKRKIYIENQQNVTNLKSLYDEGIVSNGYIDEIYTGDEFSENEQFQSKPAAMVRKVSRKKKIMEREALSFDKHHAIIQNPDTFDPWVSILLTVVLSIHIFIENIDFSATDELSLIVPLLIVICVHKFFASFALGSTLYMSGVYNRPQKQGGNSMFYFLVGIYILINLIGLGIGMAVEEIANDFLISILTSMTAGSFIFIALCEVLPKESEKARSEEISSSWYIMLSLFSGFILMTLLALVD